MQGRRRRHGEDGEPTRLEACIAQEEDGTLQSTARWILAALLTAAVCSGDSQALDFWWSKPHGWRYHRGTTFGHYQTKWRSWDEIDRPTVIPLEVEPSPSLAPSRPLFEVRRSNAPAQLNGAGSAERPTVAPASPAFRIDVPRVSQSRQQPESAADPKASGERTIELPPVRR